MSVILTIKERLLAMQDVNDFANLCFFISWQHVVGQLSDEGMNAWYDTVEHVACRRGIIALPPSERF